MRCASERVTDRARSASRHGGAGGRARGRPGAGKPRDEGMVRHAAGRGVRARRGRSAVALRRPPSSTTRTSTVTTSSPRRPRRSPRSTPVGTRGGTVPGSRSRCFRSAAPGAADVCRFWSDQSFKPKSSHFYTPVRCGVQQGQGRSRTGSTRSEVFAVTLADASGNCAESASRCTGCTTTARATRRTTATRRASRSARRCSRRAGRRRRRHRRDRLRALAGRRVGRRRRGHRPVLRPARRRRAAPAKTAALVRPSDALVVTLGDNVYENGTAEEFANCFDPTWGAFKDRIHPAPGNHDYNTPGAGPYFDYFGAKAGPDRRGWYSFDFGGWHFIMLNGVADVSRGSEQYRWAEADLAQSRDALCTIAVLHYPAFNSGATYGSVVAMRPMFEPAAVCRRRDGAVGARARLRAVRAAACRWHRGLPCAACASSSSAPAATR